MIKLQQQVSALSDQLHRALSDSQTTETSWLLIDPSPLFATARDDEWLDSFINHPDTLVALQSRAEVPFEMYPRFQRFDASQPHGSQQLRHSLQIAVAENQPHQLGQGFGRAVAAWIECGSEFALDAWPLRQHFSRFMFFQRPDARVDWLRWYDPAVLWVLWEILSPAQRKTLLGPIRRLWLLDPAGQLVSLQCDDDALTLPWNADAARSPLGLSDEQWQRIDAIGPFNQALVRVRLQAQGDAPGNASTLPALQQLRRQALGALARAQQRGIRDSQDLALYAELAMRCHPEFDQHPLVVDALQRVNSDNYFSACIADIDDMQWQRIRSELNLLHLPHQGA
jgi:Domain of unknown function (DUF4123)